MNNTKKLPLASLFLLVFTAAGLWAQSFPFALTSPRNEALGGYHSALTDQFTTFFNNPAGFRGVESDLTVADINLKVTGPVSTMLLAVQGGDIQQALGELGSGRIGFHLAGPFTLGKIGNNMAWTVFNTVNTEVFIPSLTQDATVYAGVDLGGAFGYSFGIDFPASDNQLNFGATAKLFLRSEMRVAKSFADLMAAFSDLSLLVSPDSLPFSTGFGVGLDLGMKYIWRDILSFGLTVRDAYTPMFMFHYDSLTYMANGGSPTFLYSSLPQDYSLGIMYTPQLTLLKGLIRDIRILFDYNDIFDFALNKEYSRHILLHFGLGLEFSFYDIIAIRMGLYEGLPSFGAGLDLHIFKLNLAMYGRELGTQPGLMSVYNLMLGIEFSY